MTANAGAEIASALAALVGAAHVRAGDAAAAFAVDGVRPRWVVFPASLEEVSRCLAVASASGLAVAPTAGGTRLGWGNVPRALDLVLSLRRLDRILAYEREDLTISVEAGATLGTLNMGLRLHRQFLPLDPAGAATATVGGIIATAASGPYRARYGTIRDLLLGVTVVQADGTLVKGGGQVVKNATGYDMPKLYVGALGTLGVIAAAHLRLHPRPLAETTWLFGFESAEALLDAARAIMDAPLVVSRLELVDRGTLAVLGHAGPPPAGLAVTIGSVPEGVRAQGERVAEICRRGGGAAMAVAAPDEWWRGVSDVAWPGDPAATMVLRIGSRPSDVVKALRAVEAAAGAGVTLRATAELANGVLHLVLGGPGPAGAVALVGRVREALRSLEATCVVEHAPPAVKPALDVWGEVGPALSVMRRVKAELDPRGILNPGRFVGGI